MAGSARIKQESYDDYFKNRNNKHTYDLVELFKSFETKIMRDLSSCTLAVVAKATKKNPKKISCTPFPLRDNTEMATTEVYNGMSDKGLSFKKGAIIVVVFADRDYRNSIDSMSDTENDTDSELDNLIERTGDSNLHSGTYGIAIGLISNDGSDYNSTQDDGDDNSNGTSANEDEVLAVTPTLSEGINIATVKRHSGSQAIYAPSYHMARVYGASNISSDNYRTINLGVFSGNAELHIAGVLGDLSLDLTFQCNNGIINATGEIKGGNGTLNAFIDVFKTNDKNKVLLCLRKSLIYDLILTWNSEDGFMPINGNPAYISNQWYELNESIYLNENNETGNFIDDSGNETDSFEKCTTIYEYLRRSYDFGGSSITTKGSNTLIYPIKRKVAIVSMVGNISQGTSFAIAKSDPTERVYQVTDGSWTVGMDIDNHIFIAATAISVSSVIYACFITDR